MSGYYMPPDEPLMPYYTGRVAQKRIFRRATARDVVILNRGSQWFVGVQALEIGTAQMLDSLHHGISNGRREIHTVAASELAELLRQPNRLPEIQLPRISSSERVARALNAMQTFVGRVLL